MHYCLAVDIQKEFVKDNRGKDIYKKDLAYLDYISPMQMIVAPVYMNKDNPNMGRLLDWNEMSKIRPLEFVPHMYYLHSGYSIKEYPHFEYGDTVDVIGMDTDACVLSACFDLFNLGVNFRILTDGCWSSGGKKMHEAALMIMRRQFGRAVVDTKLQQLEPFDY